MNNFINAVNESLTDMNSLSKKMFTYSLIISIISFICACTFFVIARTYWDYYDFCNNACDTFLQILELGLGAVIISIFIEIYNKSKPQ